QRDIKADVHHGDLPALGSGPDRPLRRGTPQTAQEIRTEYPISSEKRLRFMSWSSSRARTNFKLD
ncbi:hypothetical protein ABLE93_17835, partial [Xanthobacter sp. KR7-65]|uniref:hypothetical protein n=2 Tax=Xanthobacter sp. KR7-65 TaxID=3156612 RepID=UPI0032B61E84